ncbi:MAG: hypothetical protein HC853_13500 [Anaerolineae bacterium]|nr:hypothetical protein [Anaerolineae bacterium]
MVANLLLIPLFSYQAAALVTIASEIVEGSAFYFYVRRHIAPVAWLNVLARPALAAGLMALVAYPFGLVGGAFLLVGLGMGLAAYLVVLFITRALDANETALLAPLLPKRFMRLQLNSTQRPHQPKERCDSRINLSQRTQRSQRKLHSFLCDLCDLCVLCER